MQLLARAKAHAIVYGAAGEQNASVKPPPWKRIARVSKPLRLRRRSETVHSSQATPEPKSACT